jgi:PadR family transcriptional regulator PadR
MQEKRQRRRRRGRGLSRRPVRLLEPVLLLLLRDSPSHGYTLLDPLAEFGLEEIDPSIVYRALRDMEDKGWAVSSWEQEQSQGPPRRVYRLTAAGHEVLGWWAQDLEETGRILDRFLDRYGRSAEQGKEA